MDGSHVIFIDGELHIWGRDKKTGRIKKQKGRNEGPIHEVLMKRLISEQQVFDDVRYGVAARRETLARVAKEHRDHQSREQ